MGEYKMMYNPGYGEPIAETNMRFCIMEEHVGEAPSLLPKFQDQKKDLKMWITDKRASLDAVEGTLQSCACWDRSDIGNEKKECGTWHIDSSRDGVYRVHWCQ